MALTWSTASTPNTGTETISDICSAGADHFVAVGTSGTVLTSDDAGLTWTARTAAAANDWNGVAFDGTTVVAVASNGANRVMTSIDLGETWTGHAASEANSWLSVTYAAFLGMFVAVASDGVHRVMTSTDSGATWTNQTASSAELWGGVAASDTLLLALDFGASRIMTSANGTAWSAGTSPASWSSGLSKHTVSYSADAAKFALAGFDLGTSTAKVALTDDGASYTYASGGTLNGYFLFVSFVAADGFGMIGALPFDAASSPTPTIIGESEDGGATWTADDTTFSGMWNIGAWDGSTVVFWDNDKTNTMLVGLGRSVGPITPSTGTKRGGTVVTITGTGLSGITSVTFGGTAAYSVHAAADGLSVTCVTPAHAVGDVDVVLS